MRYYRLHMSLIELQQEFAIQDPEVRRSQLLEKSMDPRAVMTDADWQELQCLTPRTSRIRSHDHSVCMTAFTASFRDLQKAKPALKRGSQ